MQANEASLPLTLLRWAARALGFMVAGMAAAFFAAHAGAFFGGDPPPVAAWVSMLLLLMISAGYLIAWKFELAGALMAIAGVVLSAPRADEHAVLYAGMMSFPAVLLLVCRFWPVRTGGGASHLSSRTKRIVMSLGIAVPLTLAGLFVLEIFTHHGTPYTADTLPNELAGTWSGNGVVYVDPDTNEPSRTEVTITVHPDGSVSGIAGGAAITDAQVRKNRNWFYRKINFYTDYIIEGTLDGAIEPKERFDGAFFRIPCNIKDGALKGTIFHITRWSYDPIVNRVDLSKEGPPQGGGGG